MRGPSWNLALALAPALILATGCGRSGRDDGGESQGRAARVGTEEPAAAVCGQIAFAQSRGVGPASPALVAADDVAITPFRSERAGEPQTVSRFPAAVSPDGTQLLLLRSELLPSGKTSDDFELVGLEDGFGRAEPLALTNPVADIGATPEGLEATLLAGKRRDVQPVRGEEPAPRAMVGQIRNPGWAGNGRFIVF